jgi:DNA invertase Pin-like site-specific DNA recombinase
VLGVTGWVLAVLGIVGVLAAAAPKAVEPFAKLRVTVREDRDRLAALVQVGPIPVLEVDPYEIGVFESQLAVEAAAPGVGPAPYVSRQIDTRLATALMNAATGAGQLVVVRGEPKTGKSRSLWYGVREHFSDRKLLALRKPFEGDGDDAAREPFNSLLKLEQTISTKQGADLVVWVDDAQLHYQRGFTAENLRRLRDRYPRLVVVATLHNSALQQIEKFDPPLEQLLRRASEGLVLDPVLRGTELDDARRLYPSIGNNDDLLRLPEVLAGVNLLINRYQENTTSEPVGVAVAAAAITWQRTGMPPGTLTEALLRQLSKHTLARVAPQRDLDDVSFAAGLKWVAGVDGLLVGRPGAPRVTLLAEQQPQVEGRGGGHVGVAGVDGLLQGRPGAPRVALLHTLVSEPSVCRETRNQGNAAHSLLFATVLPVRIGYGRVSTRDQNVDGQRDALAAAGCEQILIDVASGKLAARPNLDELLRMARAGDQLVITRLDRLGRSLAHLLELAAQFEERKIDLVVLEQGIDTSSPAGRMFFAILGAVAQFERELLVERTRDGLAAARARGRTGGRPPKLGPRQVALARAMLAETNETGRRRWTQEEIADELRVSRSTLLRTLERSPAP